MHLFSNYARFMLNILPKNKQMQCLSQQLMLDYGIIQHASSPGCFNMLPLGQRSLDKLIKLIDEFMTSEVGALKVSMSVFSSKELWQKSQRFDQNNNNDIFTVIDKSEKTLCLNPTHEESICHMVSNAFGNNPTTFSISSHNVTSKFPHNIHQGNAQILVADGRNIKNTTKNKNDNAIHNDFDDNSSLLLVYQIGTKFRDESKPRNGLFRSREFLMKDAYGFHSSFESSMKTYDMINLAYTTFFARLFGPNIVKKVQTSQAIQPNDALSNNVNDNNNTNHNNNAGLMDSVSLYSHEFHLSCPGVGEDKLIECQSCGNHMLASIHPNLYFLGNQNSGDGCINDNPNRSFSSSSTIDTINTDKPIVKNRQKQTHNYIHTMSVNNLENSNADCAVCGKNLIENNYKVIETTELAHAFYLGTKFTEPFNITVNNCQDNTNNNKPDINNDNTNMKDITMNKKIIHNNNNKYPYVHMTCFGIGISRLLASSVQHFISATNKDSNDNLNLKWPLSIVPFKLGIIGPKTGSKEEIGIGRTDLSIYLANQLKSQFAQLDHEILIDDRNALSVGRRFLDLKKIGIPYVLLCGKKILSKPEPVYEFWDINNLSCEELSMPEIHQKIKNKLFF